MDTSAKPFQGRCSSRRAGDHTASPSCRKTGGQIMASSGVKQTVVPHQCSVSWVGWGAGAEVGLL